MVQCRRNFKIDEYDLFVNLILIILQIHNYTGTAVIVVSCVTKDQPYEPHPHNLVGRDCKRGVCTLKVKDTNVIR